jgi:hypothetical protein
VFRKTMCCLTIAGLSGCASVDVTALDPTTLAPTNKPTGIVYYLPAPYLLVAAIPAPAAAPVQSSNQPPQNGAGTQADTTPQAPPVVAHPAVPGPAALHPAPIEGTPTVTPPVGANATGANAPKSTPTTNGGGNNNQTDNGSGQNGSQPSQPSNATADVSFTASGPQYMMKLVYLPDYQHPMGITGKTGLWGTSSFQPTLVDGWMLTSLNASADAKTAETLTALGSIVSSVAGGGAGGAAKAAKTATSGATPTPGSNPGGGPPPSALDQAVLRPGLYKFVFDAGGKFRGLEAATFFDLNKGLLDVSPAYTVPPAAAPSSQSQ